MTLSTTIPKHSLKNSSIFERIPINPSIYLINKKNWSNVVFYIIKIMNNSVYKPLYQPTKPLCYQYYNFHCIVYSIRTFDVYWDMQTKQMSLYDKQVIYKRHLLHLVEYSIRPGNVLVQCSFGINYNLSFLLLCWHFQWLVQNMAKYSSWKYFCCFVLWNRRCSK